MAVIFDKESNRWFKKHPNTETTVTCCEQCGLFYIPSLGHDCKYRVEETVLPNGGTARPKKAGSYLFGKCVVTVYPEQVWEFCKNDVNPDTIQLDNNKAHVTMMVGIKEFRKSWQIQ